MQFSRVPAASVHFFWVGKRNEPNLPAGRQGKAHFFSTAPQKKRSYTL
jgi:hypothetical protein